MAFPAPKSTTAAPRGHARRGCAGARALGLVLSAFLLAPTVAEAAPFGSLSEFPVLSNNSAPAGIAPGPEGNEWFTEENVDKIGRVSPSGGVTEFPIPTPASRPSAIALGPDGNLWFTEHSGNKIGRITPGGEISEFPIPTPEAGPMGIAAGSDGNMWFTEYGSGAKEGKGGRIGRVTMGGFVSDILTPTAESGPLSIAAGPDGNLWFSERNQGKVGRLAPPGIISEFPVGGGPHGIAPGAEGNIWFTEEWGSKIGHISPSGTTLTEVTLPPNSRPNGIALGPDGNLWFTADAHEEVTIEGKPKTIEVSRIERITAAGEVTPFPTHALESEPEGIAAGADGNLWFTESSRNNVGLVGPGVAGPLLGAPLVTGNHEAGSPQTCPASWATWAGLQPSLSLFGWDRNQWFVNGAPILPSSATYTPTTANIGYQLTCVQTVTYPLLDVTAAAASAPVVVIPPPPTLTAVTQSAATWREGSQLARISAKGKHSGPKRHHKHKPPVGTTFAFSLSEQAGVTLTFTHAVTGRQLGHKCVAKTRRNRKHKGCRLIVTAGHLSFTGHEGVDHVRFEGRLSAHVKLKPGAYTVTISATNATGPSAPASLSFTVVK